MESKIGKLLKNPRSWSLKNYTFIDLKVQERTFLKFLDLTALKNILKHLEKNIKKSTIMALTVLEFFF